MRRIKIRFRKNTEAPDWVTIYCDDCGLEHYEYWRFVNDSWSEYKRDAIAAHIDAHHPRTDWTLLRS